MDVIQIIIPTINIVTIQIPNTGNGAAEITAIFVAF